MKCPHCYSDLAKTANQCPICGADIRSFAAPNSPAAPQTEAVRVTPTTYEDERSIRANLYGSETQNPPAVPENGGGELAQPPAHTYGAKLFQDKKDCCVTIRTNTGAGTGFFLKNGYIATNAHVIVGKPGTPAASITVEHLGKSYVGRVLRADFDEDVALLDLPLGKPAHIEDYENELGEPHDLLPGDQVFSIGNSRGWGLTYNQFVIKDITKKQDFLDYQEVILMNGTSQPGNSGGPIYNVFGQVVGILSFSPATMQQIALFLPDKSVLQTYIAAAEPGVCGAVTIHTMMSLLKKGGIES